MVKSNSDPESFKRITRSNSGSGRYASGRSSRDNSGGSSRDLSPRGSSFKSFGGPPASPSAYEACESQLVSLLRQYNAKYLDTVWKNVKKKTQKRNEGADEMGHTPSDLTDFSVWKDYQGKNAADAKFLCYRPAFAKPPLPLTLVCEAFAKFKHDAMHGVPEEVDMDFSEDFWRKLHDDSYVTSHEEMVKDMLRLFISVYLGQDVTPYYVLQGRVEADGLLMMSHLIRLVFEFKSQAGNAGEPDFQVLDAFLRACILMKGAAQGVRQHALAVCLLGPRLEVWGATVEGDKVWAEPLAESKCYGPQDYMVATARIWRGIRLFVRNYEPQPLVSPPVPWPILRMGTCIRRLVDDKLVFCFLKSNGEQEVAKVVTRYSLEAHKAWLPYAPEVYGDIVEKHGIKIVRMEYLSREKGWLPADEVVAKVKGDVAHVCKLKECIGAAVDAGHSKDFVHGDLRLCNIALRMSPAAEPDGYPAYEAKIFDFDWAGKVGHAAYPRMNKKILWPPGARYGVAITKAHDLYFKDHLVEQLQLRESAPTT